MKTKRRTYRQKTCRYVDIDTCSYRQKNGLCQFPTLIQFTENRWGKSTFENTGDSLKVIRQNTLNMYCILKFQFFRKQVVEKDFYAALILRDIIHERLHTFVLRTSYLRRNS